MSSKQYKKIIMQILKGKIAKTLEGGKYATISTIGEMVYSKVLMIYPYGFNSNIQADDSSLCLLFISGNNIFGIPYNAPLQNTLASQEVEIGNLKNGSGNIKFRADGAIEVIGDITSANNINVASAYKVADIKVLGVQQSAIANATGGSVVDVEARAALNDLLTKLRTHGLIAT